MSVCVGARGSSPPPVGLPDPATGQINGKVAVAIAPTGPGKGGMLLPPLGFVAHLTGYDDPSVDLVFPCGLWFQPPRGRYRVWVEGEWQISPFTYVMTYSPIPFRGRGQTAAAAVAEAGRVALAADVGEGPGLVLRLLHAGSYLEDGYPRWELSRRKAIHDVGEGLLMPVGPTLGALWDERKQAYVALSRPFEVEARKSVTVPLERPSGVAFLVAQLQRPALATDAADANMEVLLYRQGQQVPPDLKVPLADRTYAVWYGLAPGPAELRASTKDAFLEPRKLNLSPGKIERVSEKLALRPTWAVGSNK